MLLNCGVGEVCWQSLGLTSMRSNQQDPAELRHEIKLLSNRFLWFSASSVILFSHSVMSDSMQLMNRSMPGLPVHHQLPDYTQTHVPWVCDAIKPFHTLLSPSPLTFNLSLSGSFQMSHFFESGGQSIGVLASASILPMNIQDWFPSGWAGWISL